MGETATEIPRVTVVIPAFNAAATLERAIASALAQAPVAVEVIVVDDRSADSTLEIAARWAAKGVRLIENDRNLGASESRNVAIRAARGDYVAFLDADDEWRPGKLAAQIALAEGDSARTLIHCDGAYVGPDGRAFDRVYNHAPPVDGAEAWRALIRYCFIHTSCVMAPRAVLLELGGFDAKLVVAEDQDLWIRLALEGAVAHLPEVLTTIHDMPGSLMKREATRERDFVLPMIAGHIAAQRRRLSRREIRAALGARLTQIGRRAYANGARAAGLTCLVRAALMGAEPLANLTYPLRASRLVRGIKPIVHALVPVVQTIPAYIDWLGLQLVPARKTGAAQPCHLLLLAWSFPPRFDGGTFRPAALARFAENFGWRISVLCGTAPTNPKAGGRQLLETIPQSVSVTRVAARWRPSYRLFPRIDGGLENALAVIRHGRKEFRNAMPAVVMASGPPFHNFVAAYHLARGFGVKLALEYRDEWTANAPHFVSAGPTDKKWEARCLGAADAVIFVTDSTKEFYLREFPGLDRRKVHVLPNGWNPDEFQAAEKCQSPAGLEETDEEIVLSFVGTSGSHSLPGEFLADLTEILESDPDLRRRLRVRFIGARDTQADAQLREFDSAVPGVVQLVDPLPKPQALALMMKSRALLLILDPQYRYSMPGKTFEYIAAGPPILSYGEMGTAAELIEELSAGEIVPARDAAALGRALNALKHAPAPRQQDDQRAAWLERHTRQRIAQETIGLLNKICHRDPE